MNERMEAWVKGAQMILLVALAFVAGLTWQQREHWEDLRAIDARMRHTERVAWELRGYCTALYGADYPDALLTERSWDPAEADREEDR